MECRPQVKRVLPALSGGFGSGSAGGAACLAFPAGVGVEGGGAEGFEPGEQFVQPPVVVDPCLVVVVLVGTEPAADGLGGVGFPRNWGCSRGAGGHGPALLATGVLPVRRPAP